MGQLKDLDVIEGLLQNNHVGGLADFAHDLFPGIIRVGGANDDLQIRIDLPEVAQRRRPSRGSAGCNPLIQQIANLRYIAASPDTCLELATAEILRYKNARN
jgi:hypothetical protein